MAKEGVRPSLVIEVVSPRYREIDEKDKLAIYQQARIPEYLIVDITKAPIELTGYRLSASGRYQLSSGDSFRSETTGLTFSAGSEDLEIVVEDFETGVRLLTSSEEGEARRTAERRASEETEARLAAERRATEEAAIRKQLEDQLRVLQAKIDRLQNQ